MNHARLVRNNEYAENNDYEGNSSLKLDAENSSTNLRSFFPSKRFFSFVRRLRHSIAGVWGGERNARLGRNRPQRGVCIEARPPDFIAHCPEQRRRSSLNATRAEQVRYGGRVGLRPDRRRIGRRI